MELLALEKHAVKDNADVSRILKTARGELDDNGDFVVGGTSGTGDASDPVSLQRIVGGKLVALKPDESLESFQSNRPSPTFTGFLEHLRRDSALGVIPFEFAADSSKIGGAGVRLIVAKADRRFSFRQMILERRFIRPVWAYVIGDAIINRVFAVPSDAFEKTKPADPAAADRFWANIQNRRFSKAQKALQSSKSPWKDLPVGRLDPKLHQQSRTGRNANVKRKRPVQIVTSAKSLDSYITKIQKRVGFAKGSWINAAKAIGGKVRGTAQWVTRHKLAPGTATVKTGDKPSVTLVNTLDYIEQVSTAKGIELALQVASGRLRKALLTSLNAISGRTNRDLNRRVG